MSLTDERNSGMKGDVNMNISITGRKCTPRDSFKERVEKKLKKIERFFGEDMFEQASKIGADEAIRELRSRVQLLNPAAQEKRVTKFITG